MAPPGGGGTFAPAVRAASRALLDWSLAQYARPSNAFCHGALVLAQLLFAGMHITAASALDHIPPFSFCALRLALALPFLYWLARREGGRALRGWERAWPLPMGAAIGTAYALVFVCNQRSGPNYTAMVQPLIPLAAAAMSAALRIERVDAMKAGRAVRQRGRDDDHAAGVDERGRGAGGGGLDLSHDAADRVRDVCRAPGVGAETRPRW